MSVARRFPAATTLVSIRVAYLVGLAVAGLWTPVHHGIHRNGAYTPQGDLLFGALNRWDAGWFLRIAQHGYDVKQSSAFFPVYPLLVRGLAFVVRSHLVAGVLISLAAAAVTAELLLRIARSRLGERAARDAVLLFALYPIAFVFTAVYSDALFLMFVTASFYAAQRGNSVAAGFALLPALVILLWRRGWPRLAPLLLLPAALGAYALYLHEHFGDWRAFEHAEQGFWMRKTPALGPLQGLWDALHAGEQGLANIVRHLPPLLGAPNGYDPPYRYGTWNVVQLLLLVVAIWLTWFAWRRLGAALGAYSAATLLIVVSSPTAVIPLGSLPCFLLANFPLFIALAAIVESLPRLGEVLLVSFGALGAAAAVGFAHGAWIA